MKKITSKLLVASISAAVFMTACSDKGEDKAGMTVKKAPVADASLAEVKSSNAASIVAKKVSASLSDVAPGSDVWEDAAFTNVSLYPQTTITFNDKKAIEMNKGRQGITAKMAAVYNDKEIALTLRWNDASDNQPQGNMTDDYADGVAFQFAGSNTDAAKLPYIGMGSEGRPVTIYLQKAQYNTYEPNGNGNVDLQVNPHQTNLYGKDLADFSASVTKVGSDDYERVFVSAGFRSMTEVKDGSSKSNMKMERLGNKGWAVTLVRPLKDGLADLSKSFPVALALWDGGKNNRNGLKLLSGWNAVTVGAEDKALVAAVNEQVKGDIKMVL